MDWNRHIETQLREEMQKYLGESCKEQAAGRQQQEQKHVEEEEEGEEEEEQYTLFNQWLAVVETSKKHVRKGLKYLQVPWNKQ